MHTTRKIPIWKNWTEHSLSSGMLRRAALGIHSYMCSLWFEQTRREDSKKTRNPNINQFQACAQSWCFPEPTKGSEAIFMLSLSMAKSSLTSPPDFPLEGQKSWLQPARQDRHPVLHLQAWNLCRIGAPEVDIAAQCEAIHTVSPVGRPKHLICLLLPVLPAPALRKTSGLLFPLPPSDCPRQTAACGGLPLCLKHKCATAG